MSIVVNDNFQVNAGKPIDAKYLNGIVPWASAAATNAGIPLTYRSVGLTVNILGVEYWYATGITDLDLVIKSAGGGSVNGTLNYVAMFTPNGTSVGDSPIKIGDTSTLALPTNTANDSIAIGYGISMDGDSVIAVGNTNTITGNTNVASFGEGNTIDSSVYVGNYGLYNSITASSTVSALGIGIIVTGLSESTIIGYNITTANSQEILIANNDLGVRIDYTGNVLIGVGAFDASAIFNVEATNRGVLFPRLTTGQRNLIGSPTESLLIYNTTTSAYNYYDGAIWTTFGAGGGGIYSGSGSLIGNTVVTQGLNSLKFNSIGIDTVTISNNQVGINAVPVGLTVLTVAGTVGRIAAFTGVGSTFEFYADGSGIYTGAGANITHQYSLGTAGGVLTIGLNLGAAASATVFRQTISSILKTEMRVVSSTDARRNLGATVNYGIYDTGALPFLYVQYNTRNIAIGNLTGPTATLHVKGINNTTSYAGKYDNLAGTPLLYVRNDGRINMGSLPTSAVGLVAGDLWNNLGVVTIV